VAAPVMMATLPSREAFTGPDYSIAAAR
jgi:hypothetical protein